MDSLSVKEQKMPAQYRGTVLRYENKYPGSILSLDADFGKKNGPLSANRNSEPIASISQSTNKGLKDSAALLPTRVKKTSRVFKSSVKSIGVGVPSSVDKGKLPLVLYPRRKV